MKKIVYSRQEAEYRRFEWGRMTPEMQKQGVKKSKTG